MGAEAIIIVSLVGLKKSGKTTCCEALIREFKRRGLRVGAVKSMQKANLTIDTRGKDTWRHKQAGADFVVSLSRREMGYIERTATKPKLKDALAHIPGETDVLVCEGVVESGPDVPTIVVATSPTALQETMKVRGLGKAHRVIALTGPIARTTKKVGRCPVFDCTKPKCVRALADLIIEEGS